MNYTHPYIKYGLAVTLFHSGNTDPSLITENDLLEELERGINHFRVRADANYREKDSVKYSYTSEVKGSTVTGVFLSPSILTGDKDAVKMISALKMLRIKTVKERMGKFEVTRSLTPLSGEFTKFGRIIGRGKPKVDFKTAGCCAITTSTPNKPAMVYKTIVNGAIKRENIAIIPDLELPELVDFINLFEKLKDSATRGLMIGNVRKGKPMRPRIFDGNFPHAPQSHSLGSVALLGAIGSWGKEAHNIDWARRVLDSLKDRPIYIIGNKTFETFTYNHFVINLAKEGKLSSIIDGIYYTFLYNQGNRNNSTKNEYQKFDLFAGRFLQLFNRPAFKDFLAFRGEYPNQLEMLFKTYFINMEKVNEKTVQSVISLGRWLNYAAYLVAKSEVSNKGKEELRKAKAKALVEIESSVFSARSGDALIFQAVTRAGRISNRDAPVEAELFMTQTATGEISLEMAKHLLIAFSRVMNRMEQNKIPSGIGESRDDDDEDPSDLEDLSDAQE